MEPTTKGRLQSLDTLRGFDMFFIMGGDAMFWALGALLPGTVSRRGPDKWGTPSGTDSPSPT